MRRGRPRFANVHAIGVGAAARAVSDRIYAKGRACNVWILADGDIVVRQLGDRSYQEPAFEHLVGVYSRLHRTADIEADIEQHVTAMRAPVKAESASPHPQYWPTDARRRARSLRAAGRTVTSISAALGVPFGTVRRWVYAPQEQAA